MAITLINSAISCDYISCDNVHQSLHVHVASVLLNVADIRLLE